MRGIFNFAALDVPLPTSSIVIDTNALVGIYIAAHYHHVPLLSFTSRLALQKKPMWYNGLTEVELDHVVLRTIYQQEAVRRGMSEDDWKQLHEQDKSLMPQVQAEIDRIQVALDASQSIYRIDMTLDREFTRQRRAVMFSSGMDSADAGMVAFGQMLGTNSFLTIDRGFKHVDGINIYTHNRSLLRLRGADITNSTVVPFSVTTRQGAPNGVTPNPTPPPPAQADGQSSAHPNGSQ